MDYRNGNIRKLHPAPIEPKTIYIEVENGRIRVIRPPGYRVMIVRHEKKLHTYIKPSISPFDGRECFIMEILAIDGI